MLKYKYGIIFVFSLYLACAPNSCMCCLFPFPVAWDIYRGHLTLNNQTDENIAVYIDTLPIARIEPKETQQQNIKIDHYGQFWVNSYVVANVIDSVVNDVIFKHTFTLKAKANDFLIYSKEFILTDSLSILIKPINIIPQE